MEQKPVASLLITPDGNGGFALDDDGFDWGAYACYIQQRIEERLSLAIDLVMGRNKKSMEALGQTFRTLIGGRPR